MNWWLKALLTFLLWTAYVASYGFYGDISGAYFVSLVLIPSLVTAWVWGMTTGVLVSLFAFELTIALFAESPQLTHWRQLMTERGVANISLHAFLALSFGYFGALRRQLSAQRKLTRKAQYDELTGLLSRATFEKQFEAAITEAKGAGTRVALLFIDLDRFKFVNDTYGHEMGDELLKAVAACLRKSIRQNDLAARLGGDEFILALRDLRETHLAASVAEELVKVLGSPFEIKGKVLNVSASVGISVFPDDGEDAATLTRNADTAMYETKAAGKNAFSFSTKQAQAEHSRRLKLEQHLRLALGESQLEVHYQPQISLRTARLAGFEALLRWNHPELGNVAPSELIPLAEEAGLMIPIGHWLLREACLQAAQWQRAGFAPVKIGVNISALQFAQRDFIATITNALGDSELDPGCLELEITEGLLMKDLDVSTQTLHKLSALGIATVLDDFGTGQSSLSYLQQLPIQSLKIDRSFISLSGDNTIGEDNNTIIEAICGLAHKLGKSVVAEGVETPEQREYLRRLGCDVAQGYLFSKPLTHAQAEQYLLEEALREEKRAPKRLNVPAPLRADPAPTPFEALAQPSAATLPLGD